MPAIFITEQHVRELMDVETSIEVVEEAFRRLAVGQAENVPRRRVRASGVLLHSMCASAQYLGLVGWKNYTTTAEAARFHVAVYSVETGEMTALIEADHLGRLRTGAATGVATEFMARPDAHIVGLFGTGRQARTQLKAVCTVRRIDRVEVYSRSADRREAFAEEMSELCGTEVEPGRSPDETAAEKDIVICATTSRTPLFDGRVLDDGTHLNVIGSNSLTKAEIDVKTVQRADSIVCDSIDACRIEAGDFVQAIEERATDWRLMHELSNVVTGRQTGRARPEDVTLFKSVGLAIEDVAMAARIVDLARTEGLGEKLPF